MTQSKRRSSSEGGKLAARFRSSGLSQREFAGRNGMTISALQYWLRRTKNSEKEARQFRFVEVVGEETKDAPTCGVSMELSGGLTLRFETLPSPSYLASVVAAFEKG